MKIKTLLFYKEERKVNSISNTARSCGIKTLLSFAIIALVFWLVAMLTHNWPTVVSIWLMVLFTASFGGEFWGAFTSSIIGMMMMAWVSCIVLSVLFECERLKKEIPPFVGLGKKTFFIFLLIFIIGLLLWGVGFASSQSIYMDMSDVNAYHRAAYIAIWIPAFAFLLAFISALAHWFLFLMNSGLNSGD